MRTNAADRFETELTAEMGPTALDANVLTTGNGPASPAWLVIDEDVPARAEIVLFDGTFTGTKFATTALVNRYQDGSAAASGITHPVGAKVTSMPLSKLHDEVWDGIEDAVSFVGVRVWSDTQSIPNSASVALSFNSTPTFDTHGFKTHTNRLTIPDGLGGKYRIGARAAWAPNSTGQRGLTVYVNSVEQIGGPAVDAAAVSGLRMEVNDVLELVAGDQIQSGVFQSSGAGLDMLGGSNWAALTLQRVGA